MTNIWKLLKLVKTFFLLVMYSQLMFLKCRENVFLLSSAASSKNKIRTKVEFPRDGFKNGNKRIIYEKHP